MWICGNTGKRAQLRDVFLPSMTEVERVVLEKQAREKIQQLGVTLTPQGSLNMMKKKYERIYFFSFYFINICLCI